VVLHGEPHPNSKELTEVVQSDLRAHPDLVLVVGTKLKIPCARSIAAPWGNSLDSKEEPVSRVRPLFDHFLIEDCNEITRRYPLGCTSIL
jgi:NAD-dependent SIR2 family protein deacetylase